MTQNTDIVELQNLTVDEIVERLPSLSREQLVELRALEAADSPRKGVLEPLDAALAAAPETPAAADKPAKPGRAPRQTSTPANAPADADAAPDWQLEAYDGPLTIPQAEWRRHNVKPVREARTK